MGKQFPPLKLKEVIDLLEHNGFQKLRHRTGSHARYWGPVDGRRCHVTIDMAIREFSARGGKALDGIVKSQLGIGYKRFYAGHPDTAKRAQVEYKKFGDA